MRTFLASVVVAVVCHTQVVADYACAESRELTNAISEMFRDPEDITHGIAIENDINERYGHSITVQYTGKDGDGVGTQMKIAADVALKVGNLVLAKGFNPPGRDLIIKMALKKKEGGVINTFSVRYQWSDVLSLAKAKAKISELSVLGKIETIWLEYWPIMCLNQPPRELFAGGDGDPEEPEDVENPTGKDLSCHRR